MKGVVEAAEGLVAGSELLHRQGHLQRHSELRRRRSIGYTVASDSRAIVEIHLNSRRSHRQPYLHCLVNSMCRKIEKRTDQ